MSCSSRHKLAHKRGTSYAGPRHKARPVDSRGISQEGPEGAGCWYTDAPRRCGWPAGWRYGTPILRSPGDVVLPPTSGKDLSGRWCCAFTSYLWIISISKLQSTYPSYQHKRQEESPHRQHDKLNNANESGK